MNVIFILSVCWKFASHPCSSPNFNHRNHHDPSWGKQDFLTVINSHSSPSFTHSIFFIHFISFPITFFYKRVTFSFGHNRPAFSHTLIIRNFISAAVAICICMNRLLLPHLIAPKMKEMKMKGKWWVQKCRVNYVSCNVCFILILNGM